MDVARGTSATLPCCNSGDPGSGSQPGTSSGSATPMEDDDVKARAKAYISKNKCLSTGSVSVQPNQNVNLEPSLYDTIHNLNRQMLDAPGLHGGACSISPDISCFKLNSEAWGVPFVDKNVFGQRKNVTFNFDPNTLELGCAVHFRVEAKMKRETFRFEAKKCCFFACFASKRKTVNHKRNENERSEISKAKRKRTEKSKMKRCHRRS
jgi:hypothetical protein